MRRHFLCTASAVAMVAFAGGPGLAADLPLKAKPVVTAPLTWAGFYVGAHAGAAWSRHSYTGTDPSHIGGGTLQGLALGLHAGYNWQVNQWVFGIEGDATVIPAEKTFGDPTSDTNLRRRTDWLASIRGRLGMAFDRTLIYATGGVAWVGGNSSLVSSASCFCKHYIATGGVVGGGIEWKYNPSLSLRAEGLHYIFNRSNTLDPSFPSIDKLDNITVIRVGLSWHPSPN